MLKLRSGKELIEIPNKKRKKSSTKKTARNGFETSKEDRTQQEEKDWESFDEWEKLLELKYTKGPAAYGSVKNLQKSTNLKPSKVKLFLEGKNAHTKHKIKEKDFQHWKLLLKT